ncbi:MAG TPA: Zeta toxin [Candidatus Moranbacteria bacterium]|nr:MAG: Zeta toxin [Candidatus Moranbacteria bacterium GW2011_GWC2_45_10]KKT95195.1 MAG: Zeta toxin [Parcubacteria group bacterium GW2011_GWC1_45_14]HAV11755.1 Zeta toxin [Candidatus Moranbacteria bacterium]
MNGDELKISQEARIFIQKEKRTLLDKFCSLDNFPSVEKPFTIFMAGSPGAGKTEFSKELIILFSKYKNATEIVRIDADEIKKIIPQYNGKNSDIIQGASSLGVEKIYDHVLKYRQNALMDGTFAKYEIARENIKRSLRKGRVISVFYLYQDPLRAWEFTRKREELEGRYIPKDAFVDAFFKAKENVNAIKKEFGKDVEINLVIKNYSNETEKIKFNIDNIDNYLDMPYNKKSLSKILC